MADEKPAGPADAERLNGEKPDAGTASAVLEDRQSLRDQAADAERQRDEYRSLLLRTRADFENYEKRAQRDLAQERRYAHAGLARELLPVLDNLHRALEAARQHGDAGPLAQGVALVQSQLAEVLARFGVTPIEALDRPFDPTWHEAVMQQPRSGVSPGTVVAVLEPGYRLHDRVLRPARVAVAAPAESPAG